MGLLPLTSGFAWLVLALLAVAVQANDEADTAMGAGSIHPQRIVSINQCADELLLALADPAQIKSVTWLVQDPMVSWDAERAANTPANRGHAEEVIALNPDLVLVGDFNSRSTVAMLHGLGIRTRQVSHPESIEDVLAQIRAVGRAVGHPARGERLAAEVRAGLRALAAQAAGLEPLTAAVYQPNGYTTGDGSLIDDVMRHAGLINVAARRELTNYEYYPLELLLWDRPRLLIVNEYTDAFPSLAHEILDHPALTRTFDQVQTVAMPPQAWACGTHHVVEAVRLLQQAAQRARVAS